MGYNDEMLWDADRSAIIQIDGTLLDWIKVQTPDTWHRVALGWYYDSKGDPLLWILSQPNCDIATAMGLLFSNGTNVLAETPDQYSGWAKIYWHVCETAARRLREGYYKVTDLKIFHDVESANKFRKWVVIEEERTGREHPFSVPDEIYNYRGTREPVSDFCMADGEIRFIRSLESY